MVEAGLDETECEVLQYLVAAWNAFLRLPTEHADETSEFRHTIHAAQHLILARPTVRALNRKAER